MPPLLCPPSNDILPFWSPLDQILKETLMDEKWPKTRTQNSSQTKAPIHLLLLDLSNLVDNKTLLISSHSKVTTDKRPSPPDKCPLPRQRDMMFLFYPLKTHASQTSMQLTKVPCVWPAAHTPKLVQTTVAVHPLKLEDVPNKEAFYFPPFQCHVRQTILPEEWLPMPNAVQMRVPTMQLGAVARRAIVTHTSHTLYWHVCRLERRRLTLGEKDNGFVRHLC